MKFTLEDEDEGDESSGYITIRVVEDGDVVIDADVAPEWFPDSADDMMSFARLLQRIEGSVGL